MTIVRDRFEYLGIRFFIDPINRTRYYKHLSCQGYVEEITLTKDGLNNTSFLCHKCGDIFNETDMDPVINFRLRSKNTHSFHIGDSFLSPSPSSYALTPSPSSYALTPSPPPSAYALTPSPPPSACASLL